MKQRQLIVSGLEAVAIANAAETPVASAIIRPLSPIVLNEAQIQRTHMMVRLSTGQYARAVNLREWATFAGFHAAIFGVWDMSPRARQDVRGVTAAVDGQKFPFELRVGSQADYDLLCRFIQSWDRRGKLCTVDITIMMEVGY